jgi:hypothetical protein
MADAITVITAIPTILSTLNSIWRFIDSIRKVDKHVEYYQSKIAVIRNDTRLFRKLCNNALQTSNFHSEVQRESWENIRSALDRIDCTLNQLSKVWDEIESGRIKLLRKSGVERNAEDINRCEQKLIDDCHSIQKSLNVIHT